MLTMSPDGLLGAYQFAWLPNLLMNLRRWIFAAYQNTAALPIHIVRYREWQSHNPKVGAMPQPNGA
jgi:hypothetical protein